MTKINFSDGKVISKIEKALGFKLYAWQKRYLFLDDMKINHDYRGCGNSTIYAVKKLLTLDKKISLNWDSNDIRFLIDHRPEFSGMQNIMKPFILDIDRKLKSSGFETCLYGTKMSNETLNSFCAMSLVGTSDEELNKEPLLEIKLQDLDSVPIVYYKGKEIFDDRLVSILYNFETMSDSFGKQTIGINGWDIDGFQSNEYPSLDTIKHERFGGD
ncbi:hypothetical protein D9N16_05835 [Lactococcus raffinolactis]|uniref:hypothetical protein n=1 Tax=Pseudolactococcus raffinolactis TaxID=1366 RepID=UPI001C7024B8|nr:hypothetical protein [Lactococcus raffinolactis]MBW9298288.1 hypothetical protein [Lactococcus raffinolactis]